jgi:hypothetical protein
MACGEKVFNPETNDPIFKELEDLRDHQKELYEIQNNAYINSIRSLKEEQPNSRDYFRVKKDIITAKKLADKALQMHNYYKITAERRRLTTRYKIGRLKKDYLSTVDKEYKQFKTYQKLVTAQKAWDNRVPKLENQAELVKKATEKRF